MAVTMFWLLAAHFLGDFPCQSNWMAQNKATRLDALFIHIGIYTMILAVMATYVLGASVYVLIYIGVNSVLHGTTDFFTSKITRRLYNQPNRRHEMFCVIGFDQLLHQTALILTLQTYYIMTPTGALT